MIPLPPTVKLVLGVIIAGLMASAQYWLHAFPVVPAWVPSVIAVLTFVEGFFTIPSSKSDTNKPPPAPPTAVATMLLATTLFALPTTACTKNGQIHVPPPFPQDIEAVAACVIPLLSGGPHFDDLVTKCSPQDAQLIVDVLALLGKSDQFAAEHPAESVQASICYQQARKAGKVKNDE
jgi:hypothetical protein